MVQGAPIAQIEVILDVVFQSHEPKEARWAERCVFAGIDNSAYYLPGNDVPR